MKTYIKWQYMARAGAGAEIKVEPEPITNNFGSATLRGRLQPSIMVRKMAIILP